MWRWPQCSHHCLFHSQHLLSSIVRLWHPLCRDSGMQACLQSLSNVWMDEQMQLMASLHFATPDFATAVPIFTNTAMQHCMMIVSNQSSCCNGAVWNKELPTWHSLWLCLLLCSYVCFPLQSLPVFHQMESQTTTDGCKNHSSILGHWWQMIVFASGPGLLFHPQFSSLATSLQELSCCQSTSIPVVTKVDWLVVGGHACWEQLNQRWTACDAPNLPVRTLCAQSTSSFQTTLLNEILLFQIKSSFISCPLILQHAHVLSRTDKWVHSGLIRSTVHSIWELIMERPKQHSN